ncbi:hypothetical protein HC028_21895 [Planosporangium flavigriseum]|uniref:YtxH domain-containing protein n=1 Tax=Planosporangium flavigriseum TaxID=373681 RepID=A0A8J3PPC6_9ACTN|nr:hypothetical protein [Planosporangium flavigriseum]NJC67132.1 hypothetical protein [Planosporangium flavigriseum]GIG75753.1 hypothetical protein Pfl04_41570 [Planosporangium flavigriseum]
MRGKLMFLAGLGAGFVLGSRAGREKYEELVQTARKVRENPTVQEAAGVVQEQANKIVSGGKEKLSNSKLADTKVGERLINAMDTEPDTGSAERTQPLAPTGGRAGSTDRTTGLIDTRGTTGGGLGTTGTTTGTTTTGGATSTSTSR